MKKTIAMAILFSFLLLTLSSGTGSAITGNYKPDSTHPYVGLIVFYAIDDFGNRIPVQAASGILLSPTVVLTAAHACNPELEPTVYFDKGPITPQDLSGGYDGTAIPNPDFATYVAGNYGSPSFSYRDVGIIVLDNPVPTSVVSEYGQLPTAGLVDTLKSNTDLTLVGYGLQEHSTPRNSGLQNTWTGLIMRNNASSKLRSGNFAWSDEFVRASANPGQGKGGIAYGDSGGPVLLGQTNIVLAVNSWVNNPNCAGVTYHSRVDIPDVLSWIAEVT
jgi:hypothetical protein